ncbi:MAG TPA: hypothetical protein VEC06_12010 [Paucimonas sp.]|nr:hypothetical protein [Paucimonas sp.]
MNTTTIYSPAAAKGWIPWGILAPLLGLAFVVSTNLAGVVGWHAGWSWLLATGFEVPLTGINAGVPPLLV